MCLSFHLHIHTHVHVHVLVVQETKEPLIQRTCMSYPPWTSESGNKYCCALTPSKQCRLQTYIILFFSLFAWSILHVSLIFAFAATSHTTKFWEHMSWISQALTLAEETFAYPCYSLLANCLNHAPRQLDRSTVKLLFRGELAHKIVEPEGVTMWCNYDNYDAK